MSSGPRSVSVEIDLRLIVPDGSSRPVRCEASYDRDDPYAVRLGFHTGPEVVEWTFARSLLTDGVTHAVGDGDVRVWPASADGRPGVCLALSSPFGQALFEAPLTPIVQFLSHSYQLVPTGSEGDFVDLDAELAALLWSERDA
ncbi:MAG TPA: SsgA family sporulation/cell division regulator [Mycobacteriales bacterium]|nr:SsgA family sporulation/cell division regulator [Mycobacteriales bacterium]